MIYQAVIIDKKNVINLSNNDIEEVINRKLNYDLKIDNLNTFSIDPSGLSISIEAVKKINDWVWMKSDFTKVLIISSAEKMTPQAQNSILKIVEEPPESTVIILVSQNPDMLLDTIRSRCITIDSEIEKKEENLERAEQFSKMNFIERISFIDGLLKEENSRELALNLLEELINYFIGTKRDVNVLESLKEIYIGIKAGSNTRAGLEYIAQLL